MSRDDSIRFIHNNINTKLVTDKNRFDIAFFIVEKITIDKIKDKGPDCALYLQNLDDESVSRVGTMLKNCIENNNEKVKNMYK